MIEVPMERVWDAFKNWCEFYGVDPADHNRPTDEAVGNFSKFVEQHADWHANHDYKNYTVSEETSRKVSLLTSPHWRTILRAYEAKKVLPRMLPRKSLG